MVNHCRDLRKHRRSMDAHTSGTKKRKFHLKNYCRACFPIFPDWCRIKKSSSRSSKPSSRNHEAVAGLDNVSQEIGETRAYGSKSVRHNAARVSGNPFRGRQRRYKSTEIFPDLTTSQSKRGFRRCSSQTPTYRNRSLSRKSANNGTHSSLNRSESTKSCGIMFSDSTGLIKPPPVKLNLECSLEELCYGCTKKLNVTRDVLVHASQTIIEEEEILTVDVKAGWKKGTKITFEGKEAARPGYLPADITFVIAEKQHPLFVREGNDLEMSVEIPLLDALTGCKIAIPLLGGDMMNFKIDEIIHPGHKEIIKGQGMPNKKEQGKRGDLKVEFLVNFPSELTEEQRGDTVRILNNSFK